MSDPHAAPHEPRALRRAGPWLLAGMIAVYLVLAFGSARQKSVTVDEFGHLPSGFYFLLTGEARYAALNPPLLNALAALPLLLLDLERPPQPPPPDDDPHSFWANAYHFQDRHRPDYLRAFAAARGVPIALVAGLAVLLYAFGRRLAPEAPELAGLLAAGLTCLSPNVLAHARLVGTDTGTAFLVGLTLFTLRALLRKPRWATALLCGVALGLAQLTKFYALLLYPVGLGIALAWHALSPAPRDGRRLVLALAGAVVVSVVVLDTGYLWQEVGASLSELSLKSAALAPWQESFAGALPLPVPGGFVRALDGQLHEVASRIPSFLLGQTFEGGRWYFYLAVLAIKTPLPLLLAFGLGVALQIPRPRLPARETVLLLAYPVVLFVLLSLSPGRQLGGRALLSAAPGVWLWVAASVARAPARGPRLLAAGALLATLVVSATHYPHYLSYFNAFVGGSQQGYRYASDANVDIGQDLVALAEWLEEEGDPRVQLLYFGSVDPALYGIDYRVPGARLEPGLLAVSVTLYHLAYPMYDHGELRRVGPVDPTGLGPPIARPGGSIHVHRVGQ